MLSARSLMLSQNACSNSLKVMMLSTPLVASLSFMRLIGSMAVTTGRCAKLRPA